MQFYTFLDLDGVLTNWFKGACEVLGLDYNDPAIQEAAKTDGKIEHFLAPWGVTEQALDDEVFARGEEFWYNLELFPWAHKLYNTLNAIEGNKVIFLSAAGKFHDGASAKVRYLKDHFNSKDYILTKHKYLLAHPSRILIDDLGFNIQPFRQYGGQVFQWPNQFRLLHGNIDLNTTITYLEAKIKHHIQDFKDWDG